VDSEQQGKASDGAPTTRACVPLQLHVFTSGLSVLRKGCVSALKSQRKRIYPQSAINTAPAVELPVIRQAGLLPYLSEAVQEESFSF